MMEIIILQKKETDKDFLKIVYAQCTIVYTTFVGVRFQMFSLVISNATLFYFAYTQEFKTQTLMIFISFAAIVLTWVLFFIDKRNQYLFRRAAKNASVIEAYFYIPPEMSLFTKKPNDLKRRLTHSRVFSFLTVIFTIFWILFLFFHGTFVY